MIYDAYGKPYHPLSFTVPEWMWQETVMRMKDEQEQKRVTELRRSLNTQHVMIGDIIRVRSPRSFRG